MDEEYNDFALDIKTLYPKRIIKQEHKGDWHQSSKEYGAKYANGEYLCFPNDDSYYLPQFVEEVGKCKEDLIYYDWIWGDNDMKVRKGNPKRSYIDVGGFVVKKDVFRKIGWRNKGAEGDGHLVEDIIKSGASTKYLDFVLYVKN